MALKAEEKSSGLNIPARPASVDFVAGQRTVFPLEAFLFDDPNTTATPRLRMVPPWEFISSGIEIYEDDADPDNPQANNRRLIADDFVLKLQHYEDLPGEWVDDISLGGYDENGNFTDFMIGRGIMREQTSNDAISGGKSIPFLSGTEFYGESAYRFSNLNGEPLKLGEYDLTGNVAESSELWNGKPTYEGPYLINYGIGETVEKQQQTFAVIDRSRSNRMEGIWAGRYYIADHSNVPDTIFFRWKLAHSFTGSEIGTNFQLRLEAYLYLEVVSNVLRLRCEYDLFSSPGLQFSTGTVIQNYSTVGLVNGWNSLVFTPTFGFRFTATGTNFDIGVEAFTTLRNNSYGNSESNNIQVAEVGSGVAVTYTWGIFSKNCTYSFYVPALPSTDLMASLWVDDPTVPSPKVVLYTYDQNWFGDGEYWSFYDTEKDLVMIPADEGRTLIVGGSVLDPNRDVIIQGPTGATGLQGEKGDTGEQGPTGNYNVDGGHAGSVYLPLQNIDGGNA